MTTTDSNSYALENWEPGDLVLDADARPWVRADQVSIDQGWPWAYPGDGEPGYAPSGSREEAAPNRPLSLLTRGGKPAPMVLQPRTTGEAALNALPVHRQRRLLHETFKTLEFTSDGQPGVGWSPDTAQALGDLFTAFGVRFARQTEDAVVLRFPNPGDPRYLLEYRIHPDMVFPENPTQDWAAKWDMDA